MQYYKFKEIEELFKSYRDGPQTHMTKNEYLIFCGAIRVLNKADVDRFRKEIHLIPFTTGDGDPNRMLRGCYVSLEQEPMKEKKGIIALSPYTLGAPFVDNTGGKRFFYPLNYPTILHEYAHHYLGHKEYKNDQKAAMNEKAAQDQTVTWEKDFMNFFSSLSKEEQSQYSPDQSEMINEGSD